VSFVDAVSEKSTSQSKYSAKGKESSSLQQKWSLLFQFCMLMFGGFNDKMNYWKGENEFGFSTKLFLQFL